MADNGLTTEYRCGYCYQEFNSMTDPKELPCHHVFCLICLLEDYKENSEVCCRICQRVCQVKNMEDLPSVTLNEKVEVHTTSLTCDGANCDGQIAVSYCIQCQDKICDTHKQLHDGYFGDKHETIPISVYESSPQKYNRVLCDTHKKEITRVCENCHHLTCKECDLYSRRCKGILTADHKFSSLNQLNEEITAHFNKLLQSSSDKLTEICKLDKEIWKTLDEQEVHCKQSILMIERYRDEHIAKIREKSEALKERFYGYQKRLTNQVEVYNSELMAKKEQLEMSRTKVHRWLRESHVTEKVKQRQQMTEELMNSTPTALDYTLTKLPTVISTDASKQWSVNLVSLPVSLDMRSKLNANQHCLSASHHINGDLVIGTMQGLRICRQGLQSLTDYSIKGLDCKLSIGDVRYGNYILHRVNVSYHVDTWMNDDVQELFDFKVPTTILPFLAVSDHHIVATNPGSHQVILYDFTSKRLTTAVLTTALWVVCFLPDGGLLATGGEDELRKHRKNYKPAADYTKVNFLAKYCIKDGKLVQVWKCENLPYACGVCADQHGLIFVSTFKNKTIYIISPTGEKLHQFTHQDLPDPAGQISIWNDQLAVPGWESNKAHLFTIQRE